MEDTQKEFLDMLPAPYLERLIKQNELSKRLNNANPREYLSENAKAKPPSSTPKQNYGRDIYG